MPPELLLPCGCRRQAFADQDHMARRPLKAWMRPRSAVGPASRALKVGDPGIDRIAAGSPYEGIPFVRAGGGAARAHARAPTGQRTGVGDA